MNTVALCFLLAATLEGDWPSEGRVTMQAESEPAEAVLGKIAEAAGLSLVIPDGVASQRVTVSFRDTPVRDAFRTVLEASGLRAERSGSLVRVLDADPESGSRHRHRPHRDPGVPERVRVGGSVVVHEGEEVSEAVAVGGDVEVRGKAREAVAVGGDVRVLGRGEVTREAVAIGGKIHVDPEAKVAGDRVEFGSKTIPAIVGGLLGLGAAASLAWSFVHGLATFVVFFVVGWILLALAPQRLEAVAGTLAARPLRSGLIGMLGAVVAALTSCLLVVSILGIPLVPLVALGIVAAIVFGMAAIALRLGRALPLGHEKGGVLSLAMGTLVLVVLRHIPWVGGLVIWLLTLFAFGAVVLARGGSAPTAPAGVPAHADAPAT